ncbi:MAG TPA: hypothetical protein VH325_05735 [Bryobacteraceae bacterium]|jgi:hypothetical protein|nr:hypothetical protein [Bryobacteraceae bacterium]
MNPFRSAWREIVGLFVEDWRFALVIAVWVLVAIFVLPRLLPAVWRGPVFFFGVLGIIIDNLLRSSR